MTTASSISSELETLFSCVNKLGTDSSHLATSCRDIYNYNMASRGQSGCYWIKTDQMYRVYCDMELTCGGITGGWMRIANIDTSQGDDCPSGWRKIAQPKPLCRGSGDAAGCYSTNFSNSKAIREFIHYLDDFVVLGPPGSKECTEHLQILKRVCNNLGIPLAPEKQ